MELEDATTTELWEEIKHRAIASVLLLVLPAEGGESCDTFSFRHGNRFTQVGMLASEYHKQIKLINETTEPLDEELQ